MFIKKEFFLDFIRLYVILITLGTCFELIRIRKFSLLFVKDNHFVNNHNDLSFSYRKNAQSTKSLNLNSSSVFKDLMYNFLNLKYTTYSRLTIFPLTIKTENRKHSNPNIRIIEKCFQNNSFEHHSASRVFQSNLNQTGDISESENKSFYITTQSKLLNNSFFDLQMNIPVNISAIYHSNPNPIKKDTYLENEHYNFSNESSEGSNKQKLETMDFIYKQDVDLGFPLTPTNMSSNIKNDNCKREEDTEKLEAIQSLKDCKATEMNYLQDLDLGYFLSSPCQNNKKEPEVCGDKDERPNGSVKKKANNNSLDDVLQNNAIDAWAGIPFKIDNETGEYIRLPLDELFQDVLPFSDDNSNDISLSKATKKIDGMKSSELLDLSTDFSVIMQSLWCPLKDDKNMGVENHTGDCTPERCKIVESETASSVIPNNPRMDTRNQDIGNIFSPVSGFYGMNTGINPYTRCHTHFQTKNNSNLVSYSSRQPSFYNIHKEENCFPPNCSQNLESIGFTYGVANGEYKNVTTTSVDIGPNEGFFTQFLNEECSHLMDISGNEKTMQCNHTALPMGSSDGITSQSDKGTDINSSTCTNIIERFDLSCDSAVSSLSSERVHSASDGEWGEGSDSGQDYHQTNYYGPHDYSSNNRSFSSRTMHVAQKKYHLFGKRYYQEQSMENSIIQSTLQTTNSEMEHDRIENVVENSMYNECMVQMHHPFPKRNYDKFNYSNGKSERDKCVLQRSQDHLIRHNHTYTQLNGSREPLRRESSEAKYVSTDGHLTRDEKRARNLNVPISVADIINLPMDEFNERISKYDLTENQLSLIRDIRRRGKNKVAAQNCRKRKLDQIISLEGEVKEVRRRKEKLNNERSFIAAEKKRIANKFATLHQHIFQFLRDDDGNPCSPSKYSLQQALDGTVYLLLRENSKVDSDTNMPFLIENNDMISTSNLVCNRRLSPSLNKDTLENLSCQSINDSN